MQIFPFYNILDASGGTLGQCTTKLCDKLLIKHLISCEKRATVNEIEDVFTFPSQKLDQRVSSSFRRDLQRLELLIEKLIS